MRTSDVESSSFEVPKKRKFNFYFIETGEGKGIDWAVLTGRTYGYITHYKHYTIESVEHTKIGSGMAQITI